MNLRQLQHLLTVAESGSFSRAAKVVHLTQSALSRSIRALEKECGLQLIDRIGKRNELTAAGRSVAERARRILLEAAELRQIAPHLNAGLTGTLDVGLGSGPGAVLSAPLLTHFARHYPQVKLTVSRASTELLLQSLRERKLVALVVDVRSVPPAADLAIESLPEMRAGFLCRAGHPLAGSRAIDFDAVLAYPIASTPLSDEVGRMLVENFGPRALPLDMVTLRCDDIASLIQATLNSDAVFLGIFAAARGHIERGELVALSLTPRFRRTARFALITLAGRSEPPALRLLRSFVVDRMHD